MTNKKEIEVNGTKIVVSTNGKIRCGCCNVAIKQYLNSSGYKFVVINGKTFLAHRILAMCFIENQHNKPFINHINRVKEDNRIENLEWVTAKENSEHASLTGFFTVRNKAVSDSDLEKIKSYIESNSITALTSISSVSLFNIRKMINERIANKSMLTRVINSINKQKTKYDKLIQELEA